MWCSIVFSKTITQCGYVFSLLFCGSLVIILVNLEKELFWSKNLILKAVENKENKKQRTPNELLEGISKVTMHLLAFYYFRLSISEIGICLFHQSVGANSYSHYLDKEVSNFERSIFFFDLNTVTVRFNGGT